MLLWVNNEEKCDITYLHPPEEDADGKLTFKLLNLWRRIYLKDMSSLGSSTYNNSTYLNRSGAGAVH